MVVIGSPALFESHVPRPLVAADFYARQYLATGKSHQAEREQLAPQELR